jgi:heme-degrading monooxygenase HmoA
MIDAGLAYVQNTVMPTLSHVDGFVGLSLITDRMTGRCIATSAWRTEQAMLASGARASSLRDSAAEAFGGTSSVDMWEIAVMHRAHHARPGTAMRVTWCGTDPGNIDSTVDVFQNGTLSQIEDLPGFCSISLLVNRDSGRAVVTVAYDDRGALDASRSSSDHIREEASRQTGLDVTEVAEFDLMMARLHAPATV